jgi:hypothetical protein
MGTQINTDDIAPKPSGGPAAVAGNNAVTADPEDRQKTQTELEMEAGHKRSDYFASLGASRPQLTSDDRAPPADTGDAAKQAQAESTKGEIASAERSPSHKSADVNARASRVTNSSWVRRSVFKMRLRCEVLCSFRMRQGRVELFERPIYFPVGDHQGWTDTDNVVVGVLAQDSAPTQRVAVAPGAARVRVKLDSDH